jgi:protein-tyrosine phosphatase
MLAHANPMSGWFWRGTARCGLAEEFVVLAVCAGNLHRSALAEVLLRRWAAWYLPSPLAARVRMVSAGVIAPAGAPMGDRVQQIAEALGADGSAHSATRLTDAHVRDADLVLTASRRHRDTVLEREPSAVRRTFTIREAGRIAASLAPARATTVHDLRDAVGMLADRRTPGEDDIIDPEGLDDRAYAALVEQEVPALVRLAAMLFGMPKGDVEQYMKVVATGEGLPFRVTAQAAGDAEVDAGSSRGTAHRA